MVRAPLLSGAQRRAALVGHSGPSRSLRWPAAIATLCSALRHNARPRRDQVWGHPGTRAATAVVRVLGANTRCAGRVLPKAGGPGVRPEGRAACAGQRGRGKAPPWRSALWEVARGAAGCWLCGRRRSGACRLGVGGRSANSVDRRAHPGFRQRLMNVDRSRRPRETDCGCPVFPAVDGTPEDGRGGGSTPPERDLRRDEGWRHR